LKPRRKHTRNGSNYWEIVPGVSRVAILGAVGDPHFAFAMASLKRSAPGVGVSITAVEVKSADDLGQAFDEMKRTQNASSARRIWISHVYQHQKNN
jgi:hypothetical protein